MFNIAGSDRPPLRPRTRRNLSDHMRYNYCEAGYSSIENYKDKTCDKCDNNGQYYICSMLYHTIFGKLCRICIEHYERTDANFGLGLGVTQEDIEF